jgi:outer membrane protein assembly factor BamA
VPIQIRGDNQTREKPAPGRLRTTVGDRQNWWRVFHTFFLVGIVLIVGIEPLSAQSPASDVNYEGQKIAKVDLIGHPSLDVNPLRGLLLIQPGDAYSSKRVEASVQALKLTGHFGKVEPQVRAEAAGLSLVFVLEPASYIGVITFPGATKVFSYTRLLQVANLPDQDPYQEKEVERADAALVKFFQGNGFFLASVQHELQLDDVHQIANIIFHVNLGKRARFGEVQIIGPPAAESAHLAQRFHSYRAILVGAYLKKGRVYTREHLDRSEKFLNGVLSKEKHPASKVQLTAHYHPDTNRADLIFKVAEGPIVNVTVKGSNLAARLPFQEGRTLRRLVPIYEEGAFDSDLIEEGEKNIVNHFQSKGYFDVAVSTKITKTPDKVDVVYEVNKGTKHKVVSIQFAGNTHFSNDVLLAQVSIQKAAFLSHGMANASLVAKSASNLERFYRSAGYEDVKVRGNVVDHEPAIDVRFQIKEGEQTIVEAVRYEGNRAFSSESLDPPSGPGIVTGQPYSQSRLNVDRDQILARYFEQGYLKARLRSSVQRHSDDPHRVDVVYHIDEGPKVRVSDVLFLGQQHTKRSYLNTATDLRVEEPLSETKILETESRLYNLGILDWASVGPRRVITDQNEEIVLVKTHEAKRNTLAYGFGFEWSKRAGLPSGTVAVPGLPPTSLGNFNAATAGEKAYPSPRGSVEFTRKNMRGLGETASISARFSRLDQRGALSYSQPHFVGSAWNSLLSASAERSSENPIFSSRIGEASFHVERTLDRDRTKTLLLRYTLRRTVLTNLLIPDLVPLQDRALRLSTASASYIRDTRDKPLDAHKGMLQSVDFGITPSGLGSSANFVRFLGQIAYYKEIGKSIVWANSIRLGVAKPFSGSRIPLSERFFSGGPTSLRGYPINGAGAQREISACRNPKDPKTCTAIKVPVGGNDLLIINSELRFPLPVRKGLGGVAFYDGGNVYDHFRFGTFTNQYSNSVGFGLRYETPAGPVRFDIAKRVNPATGFSTVQYFFTIGQAF